MGFRTYLGKIEKKIIDDLKDKNIVEVKLYFNDVNFEIDSFRKYTKEIMEINFYEFDFFKNINEEKFHKSVYYTGEENHDTFWSLIDGEKDFLNFINWEKKSVYEYYLKLSSSFDEKKFISYFTGRMFDWNEDTTYNLDKNSKVIVDSTEREYAIFEHVRLYKEFDFNNNYLVFYGY